MSDPVPSEKQEMPLWARRFGSILLAIFCFELGLILVIYPWTPWWPRNYFAYTLRDYWGNPYLRGAVSGVGLLNIWIAIVEVFRMFSRR